ncbi:MAG: 4'-phosphopantetheinyl transferase superfamily protein [Gemmatimonadota bacterium]
MAPRGTASPLTSPMRVGNDVVDLGHPRTRSRPEGDRLPRRILAPGELDRVEGMEPGVERDRLLWTHWAGKETAFKVVSKLLGSPPVFEHRAFELSHLREKGRCGRIIELEGRVRWQEVEVCIEGVVSDEFIHMVGWGPLGRSGRPVVEMGVEGSSPHDEEPPDDPGDQEPEAGASQRESLTARSHLSRRARLLARSRLAGHLRVMARTDHAHSDASSAPDPRIEILTSPEAPGRSPPRVIVDGIHRPELDLSLSHHGRYIGWAILLPREGFGRGSPETS